MKPKINPYLTKPTNKKIAVSPWSTEDSVKIHKHHWDILTLFARHNLPDLADLFEKYILENKGELLEISETDLDKFLKLIPDMQNILAQTSPLVPIPAGSVDEQDNTPYIIMLQGLLDLLMISRDENVGIDKRVE